MLFTVPESYDNQPLRNYLVGGLHLSVRLLARLKVHPRGIVLGGERVTVRRIIHSGDTLELAIEDITPGQPGHVLPVPAVHPLPILMEDEDIIVCAKPADMPTHPSHGHFTDTLANALAYREQQRAPDLPFVFHPITRLDRNTSGVVLIARHPLSAQRLTAAMMAGEIRKTYLALLCGVPTPTGGEIITGIRRQQDSVITREVTPSDRTDADLAHTRYQTLATFCSPLLPDRTLSLVRAHPLTGRTHQLRLHFAHIGTPILGDDLYGQGFLSCVMERHALHSHTLQFPHPRSGESITVTAPLPEDMARLLPDGINFKPTVYF